MPDGPFIFCLYLLVAYLLFKATRRFAVKSQISHVTLFGILMIFTFVALPVTWRLVKSGMLRHERNGQREIVRSRIAEAGGWEVLRRDAQSLTEQHKDNYFEWDKHDTNVLPAAFTTLKPMLVEYRPPKSLSELIDGKFTVPPNVHVVRIRIFGMHSTGGHSTPYFGLEIVTGPELESYRPRPGNGAYGNSHLNYTKVAEGIYEIY